jgi:hypothetical protein
MQLRGASVDPEISGKRDVEQPITAHTTVVASPHQVSTSIGEEAVILGAEAGQYFGLKDVGARVWELVQEPQRVEALCAILCNEYDVAADDCQRDVIALLTDLQQRGLLDVQAEPGTR